jgi:hypothetical protein
MRIALISDSHTKENIEFILSYLKKKSLEWRPDIILINGDILGENEVREGYGYSFNRTLFYASLDKDKILHSVFPEKFEDLKRMAKAYEQGQFDERAELEFANAIKDYVTARYNYAFNILKEFSTIGKTYYNVGTYESPLLYNVLKELSFLLDINEQYIRRVALLINYRETFKEFQTKIKDPVMKKLNFLGGLTALEGDLLLVGIPGLSSSTIPGDSTSDFQEKMTEDLIATVMRQMSYASKILILNQTQGKLRKDPFAFRPASFAVRNFIESTQSKFKQKIFVQSYHHWMTTHFYFASDFHFILNNAAVNNCLFNLIEIGNKINCYDVDPKNEKVRKLNIYNYNLVDYALPEERLTLNYEMPKEIIEERKIQGCYYM